MSSINIGLIGCGRRVRSVAKHLLKNSDYGSMLNIAALYDPRAEAVAETNSHLGTSARAFESVKALLSEGNVDWGLVSSWNSQHAAQAAAALSAGKHVFCEKPLATSLDDCLTLREALAAAPKQHFSFGLVLRYTALYQKAKELLSGGVIGTLLSFEFNETLNFNHGGYIHGNWRRNRALAGTHLLEKCCHDFDLVHWLIDSLPVRAASFGGKDFFLPQNHSLAERIGTNAQGKLAYSTWSDPQRVDPFSEGATIVDNQVAIMEYANGARGTFHTNCNGALIERRMYFMGTEGGLRLDAITGKIEYQRIGHDTRPEVIQVGAGGGSGDNHLGGDAHMANHLAATMVAGKPPLATLEDGLRSAVAIFGVDQALDTQSVVDLRPLWQQVGVSL